MVDLESERDEAAHQEMVARLVRAAQFEPLLLTAETVRWLGAAVQLRIDYDTLPTLQFVRKYGPGVTSRMVGDVARAALAHARGGA
jgi:hypothetical protein